ncbi:MAG: 23S rRNA (pseudouridine(1915)-N(3))-methyltransferase RlmH [Saprospiraceae bacterium]|nr:23S rRNA (pseudouridine(1915)-N(3))-methyltransferase RlmH [Saprospiraceae bacterium]
MKIECWFVGKTKDPGVSRGLEEYTRRLRTFMPVHIRELKDAGTGEDAPQKEGREILRTLQSADILILLDEKGVQMNSRDFADQIEKWQHKSGSRIIFLVGGAYGFSQDVYQRAHSLLSLSAMTFSHQLVRLVFLEQLYRAATILHRHPYHHD